MVIYMKREIGIVTCVFNIEDAQKMMKAIKESEPPKGTEMVIVYPQNNKSLGRWLRAQDIKGCKVRVMERKLNVRSKYVLFIRRMKGQRFLRLFDLSIAQGGIKRKEIYLSYASKKCRAKWILYLYPDMYIKKEFWILINQYKEQLNKNGVIIIDYSKKNEMKACWNKKGHQLEQMVMAMNGMQYAVLWRKKKYRETKRCLKFSSTNASYNMEFAIYTRALEDNYGILSGPIIGYDQKTFDGDISNMFKPIERIAFLKGIFRFYHTVNNKTKVDYSPFISMGHKPEELFMQELNIIADNFENAGDDYTAKRYRNLIQSI